jgi:hypothetical protein
MFRTALSVAVDRSISCNTHTLTRACHPRHSHLSITWCRYKVDAAIYLMEHDANVADTVKVLAGLDKRYIRS